MEREKIKMILKIKLAQQQYNQKSPFNETKKEGNSLVKVAKSSIRKR